MENTKDKAYTDLPIYLFVISIFIFIISPNLFSDGMFMDGLIYSSVAQNLSEGLGSFWNPQFTAIYLQDFHEHPPLAFGIHSIFYSVFGDSRFVDKSYSILTFIIVGYIIHLIWTQLKLKRSWLPILLWLMTPLVGWSSTNNMLENTMSIFTTLSVLFYLKSQDKKTHYFIFLSGTMLFLGFLSKGFFAFFPWSFPFIYWICQKNNSFKKMVLESIGIIFYTLGPLLLLILLSPEAKMSLQKYFDIQVVNSLQNIVTVDSRFFILKKLFMELLPAIGITLLLVFIAWRKKENLNFLQKQSSTALTFLLLGLTGVLPIMISLKQNGFYIVTALPLFAIGIALLTYPLIEKWSENLSFHTKGFRVFKWISYACFVVSISTALYFSTQIGRDKDRLHDVYLILPHLEEGTIVQIPSTLFSDWSLHGYFSRYKNISLDDQWINQRDFLMIRKSDYHDSLSKSFTPIPLSTIELLLFKRIK